MHDLSKLKNPSYDDLHQLCRVVAEHIQRNKKEYKAILGVSRGGLIPAVIMSHMLGNIPVIPISYSSKQGEGDKIHDNKLPKLELGIHFPALLVDEVAGTGNTIEEITEAYYGAEVDTFILVNKSEANYTYGHKVTPTIGWITFPWEVK